MFLSTLSFWTQIIDNISSLTFKFTFLLVNRLTFKQAKMGDKAPETQTFNEAFTVSSVWSHQAECKGMTNLHPNGEWYFIPTS